MAPSRRPRGKPVKLRAASIGAKLGKLGLSAGPVSKPSGVVMRYGRNALRIAVRSGKFSSGAIVTGRSGLIVQTAKGEISRIGGGHRGVGVEFRRLSQNMVKELEPYRRTKQEPPPELKVRGVGKMAMTALFPKKVAFLGAAAKIGVKYIPAVVEGNIATIGLPGMAIEAVRTRLTRKFMSYRGGRAAALTFGGMSVVFQGWDIADQMFKVLVHSANFIMTQTAASEAEYTLKQVQQGLQTSAPGGQRLEPLKDKTLAARALMGITDTRPLMRTQEMYNALKVVSFGAGAFVGIPAGSLGSDGRDLAEISVLQEEGFRKVITDPEKVRKIRAWLQINLGEPLTGGKGDDFVHLEVKGRPFLRPAIAAAQKDQVSRVMGFFARAVATELYFLPRAWHMQLKGAFPSLFGS